MSVESVNKENKIIKVILCNLRWHKIILVSVLFGALFGAFDNQTVFSVAEGCPDGQQCRSIGCTAAPGARRCVYQNIYGVDNCPTSIECPDWAD